MHIAIFLFDGITALDAIGPYASLTRLPQVQIQFVGKQAGLVRAGDGFLGLQADAGIGDEPAADMLLIPGGAVDSVMEDAAVQDWIRRADRTSQWTTSVCSGSLILAAAGILAGRTAATHWARKRQLEELGVRYSPERVVIDGKYVTSAGVSAGIDMGLVLCEMIAGRAVAEAVQLSMQYDPQPPFDCGDPERSATPERLQILRSQLRI